MDADLQNLINAGHPEAVALQRSIQALVARYAAEDRLRVSTVAEKSANEAEQRARLQRDHTLAALDQRQAGAADEVMIAECNLERAKIAAAYRPFAVALGQAEDIVAKAQLDLEAARRIEAKHPIGGTHL